MGLYWYRLLNNPGQASIIGGSVAEMLNEITNKKYECEVFETKSGKYGIKFKIAVS